MKYIINILFFITSCAVDNKYEQEELKLRFINGQCDQGYLVSPYQLEANFKAFYYGPKLSHIDVNLIESYGQREMLNHFDSVMNIKDPNLAFLVGRYPIIAQKDYVNIFIDTSQEIGTNYLANESMSIFGKRETCIMHYPVIIENRYPSFFQIGYGDEIGFIFEAINTSGNWAAISHPPIIYCGTGLQAVSLSSKEIVISALPITEGSFKTMGRLKLGNAFSNEISVAIDTSTFDFQLK